NVLEALKQFDYVMIGYSATLGAIGKLLGRECYYVPFGVDAMRFSPFPNAPSRCIDVYSIGRKWEGVHAALQNLASRREIFYAYDTSVQGGSLEIGCLRSHRDLLANMAKRSRFFVVAPAKMNAPAETSGQVEIGSRFYEGAASGAVMIGQA